MKGIKNIALAAAMAVCGTANSAEASRSVIRQAGASSFHLEIPEGWTAREVESSEQGGTRLLEIVTVGSDAQGRPPALSAVIKFVFYPDKVPITAQRYWEGLTYDGNVEYPRVDGLASWSMFGRYGRRDGEIATAYYQLRSGVLLADLSDQTDESYKQAEKVFLEVLRSFREVKGST